MTKQPKEKASQSTAKQCKWLAFLVDAMYRLTGEKITEGDDTTEYTYAYDAVSNRISKTKNGEETTSTYNELNQLINEGETAYEYDAAGNTVSVISPEKTASYTYNANNNLIRATLVQGNNVTVEEYEYDYAGNRTVKKTESEYTYYLNDVNGDLAYITAEIDENGNVKCYYTRGDEIISQKRQGNTSIYLSDGQGSVRQLADMSSVVTDNYVYDAWGNLISSAGSTENSCMYCSEQNDASTGLYYLRARYMDTATGRFITQDTYAGSVSDPVSLHKYLYANANPVSNCDPSGHFAMLIATLAANSISAQLESEYDKHVLEIGMKILNALVTVYDIQKTIIECLNSGATGMDLAVSLACGIISAIVLNFSCAILALGTLGVAIFAVAAFVMGFGVGYTLAEGDNETALIRAFQLVCIFFAAACPSCFTGDTPVAAESGMKRIDEIKAGDKVWAYNIETGETELREVLQVYVKETDEILHLYTTGDEIQTTTNHPFYVKDKGWTAAGDLEEGDEFYTADGQTVTVKGKVTEKLEEPIKVYNLEVEGLHTYFVGNVQILVHNQYTNNDLPANREMTDDVIQELKKSNMLSKFTNAMKKGLAESRQNANGIIELTKNEKEFYKGIEHIFKIKVKNAPNHLRVYGYIKEIEGGVKLVFDYITKGK
ncbi:MAG: polymorphic toxin-type HINT domain-containing protein [Oscillospiraceae bacterium]|nr:polymorphic toxin-type HINT domain-containing protein [Oscillospiraceae bacterium]